MEILMQVLAVIFRSVVAVASLFIISRITGERQISQLTFYDYIVGITIGSIAAMAVETDISLWLVLTAMVIFGGFTLLLSFLTTKSMVLRRLLTGVPHVMIYNGKIIKKNLKKHFYDINDLLLMCRAKGYYDVSQIQCAVMETNGQLSVLPKAEYHPVTPNDIKQPVKGEFLLYNLIIDGKIMKNNLKAYGKDESWLKAKLNEQKVDGVADVLLCVGNNENQISVFLQNEQLEQENFFM